MNKAINILSKYQNYLLGIAIFLSLSAVSITIGQGQIKLNLQNYPVLMILLVLVGIVLALIYVRIDKHQIKNLSKRIKEKSIKDNVSFNALFTELTSRQKEVYELIMSGKTNKDIMENLFIEQSTLKTHINQIYKKLNIKNRKELKSKINIWLSIFMKKSTLFQP